MSFTFWYEGQKYSTKITPYEFICFFWSFSLYVHSRYEGLLLIQRLNTRDCHYVLAQEEWMLQVNDRSEFDNFLIFDTCFLLLIQQWLLICFNGCEFHHQLLYIAHIGSKQSYSFCQRPCCGVVYDLDQPVTGSSWWSLLGLVLVQLPDGLALTFPAVSVWANDSSHQGSGTLPNQALISQTTLHQIGCSCITVFYQI